MIMCTLHYILPKNKDILPRPRGNNLLCARIFDNVSTVANNIGIVAFSTEKLLGMTISFHCLTFNLCRQSESDFEHLKCSKLNLTREFVLKVAQTQYVRLV